MRMPTFILLVAMTGPALAGPSDCPLDGVWKSDASRTLADLGADRAPPASPTNFVSSGVFGRLYHEWTCSHFRHWFEDQDPGEFWPFELRSSDSQSVVVNLQNGIEAPLKLIIEGDCYKVRVGQKAYHEYFCRVDKP